MKGFIDENGYDMPPCWTCKYRGRMTNEVPCYDCISIIDLESRQPNCETEFTSYEPIEQI